MGVWIAGCLEDQTAGMKGDGETVVSKKSGLCGKDCVFMGKKNRCFYGNSVSVSVCYCVN